METHSNLCPRPEGRKNLGYLRNRKKPPGLVFYSVSGRGEWKDPRAEGGLEQGWWAIFRDLDFILISNGSCRESLMLGSDFSKFIT